MFGGVAVVGVALMVWALRMPAALPDGTARLRDLLDRRAPAAGARGMWLTTLPGLLFGTIGVLAPLRLDELGAGSAAIAAVFLVARRAGGDRQPDGRAPLRPARPARAERDRGAWARRAAGRAAAVAGLGLGPRRPGDRRRAGDRDRSTRPAMAMLSDGAERFGLEQGFAFALVNLAWATGQASATPAAHGSPTPPATSVPYLILAGVCAVTLAGVLVRDRLARRPRARASLTLPPDGGRSSSTARRSPRQVRAEVAGDVAAWIRPPGTPARPGDRAGRRRPGVGHLRRRQAAGVAPRSASQGFDHRLARGRRARRGRAAAARAQRRPARVRHPAPAARRRRRWTAPR